MAAFVFITAAGRARIAGKDDRPDRKSLLVPDAPKCKGVISRFFPVFRADHISRPPIPMIAFRSRRIPVFET